MNLVLIIGFCYFVQNLKNVVLRKTNGFVVVNNVCIENFDSFFVHLNNLIKNSETFAKTL